MRLKRHGLIHVFLSFFHLSDILKERRKKGSKFLMFKDLERKTNGRHIPTLKNRNHEVLDDVWILDKITEYNCGFLQTTVMSGATEYFVLYEKKENFDITQAYEWFVLDAPVK